MSIPEAADEATELASRLALVIGRLNRRMLRGGQGLSHGVLSALSSVVKFGPIRPGDLATKESVAAPTMTRIIARLETEGLIKREVDPSDRRAFVIEATAEGSELVLRARSARADVLADMLKFLPAEDLQVLRDSLSSFETLLAVETS